MVRGDAGGCNRFLRYAFQHWFYAPGESRSDCVFELALTAKEGGKRELSTIFHFFSRKLTHAHLFGDFSVAPH